MTIHSASARLDGADPADIIARVGAGLDQMDQPYRADPAQWLDYDTGIGLIRLRSSDGGLAIDLEADSAGNLHMLREGITWQLDQLGLPEQFKGVTNPFPWMSEIMDLRKEKNFFETRVTEYQVGGALSWD